MKPHPYLSILSSFLLLLLSLTTVIEQHTHLESTNPTTPLFTRYNPRYTTLQPTTQLSSHYLGDSEKTIAPYAFTHQTDNPFYQLYLLIKQLPHSTQQQLLSYLIPQTGKQPSYKIHLLNRITSLETPQHILKENIFNLSDLYYTYFPTCVIVVLITIILLYVYVLAVEITDLIIFILENLF